MEKIPNYTNYCLNIKAAFSEKSFQNSEDLGRYNLYNILLSTGVYRNMVRIIDSLYIYHRLIIVTSPSFYPIGTDQTLGHDDNYAYKYPVLTPT